MTDASEYQRARKPEQKEERRSHLLNMARGLLAGGMDTQDFSLNGLARQAGMAKSNVYRYFESREAVLLELLWQEWEHWAEDLREAMRPAPGRAASLEEIARAFAHAAAQRPLLGRLSSVLPSIIEHNITLDRVLNFKSASLMLLREMAQFFHGRTPSMPASAFEEFGHQAFALMIGIWPLCHPSAAVEAMLSAPEFEPFRHEFERDFARGLLLILRGLAFEAQGRE